MSRRNAKEEEVVEEEVDEIEEDEPKEKPKKKKSSKVKDAAKSGNNTAAPPMVKKSYYNWSAIFILLLFTIPPLFVGIVHVYDMMYPEEAKARKTNEALQTVKQRVIDCYAVANPKKLSEVDKFMKKYKNNLRLLQVRLAEQYGKYEECVF